MNIIIVSGMNSRTNPMAGIFVSRRLEALKSYSVGFTAIALETEESHGLRSLKRLLRRPPLPKVSDVSDIKSDRAQSPRIDFLTSKRTLIHLFPPFREVRFIRALENGLINKPNLIHAHWIYPHGYAAVKLGEKLGIPVVVTAHGSDVNVLPHRSAFLRKKVVYTIERASRSIFVSDALRRAAKDLGYSGKNSAVIPNGIDKRQFHVMKKNQVRQQLGLDTKKRYVGFVGNLVSVKRADKLPEIFSRINSKENVAFLVVGDGPLRRVIEQECASKNLEVLFLGRVPPDDVAKSMNALDVLVLPSREEGFGCVAIEAQACGVAVVGSDRGGIPEAIGDGGMVVQDGEGFEKRFAEAVCHMIRHPISADTLRARAIQYDWSITVGREIDVYKELLSQQNERRS